MSPQERILERIIVRILIVSVPQFQEQIVEFMFIQTVQKTWKVPAARWRQLSTFTYHCGGRNRGMNSLRVGGW